MYKVSEKSTGGSVEHDNENIYINQSSIIYDSSGISYEPWRWQFYAIIISEVLVWEMVKIFAFKYKQIGRKVAYYRRLRNLTQEELARRIHISKSSLCKIECGRYNNNISLSMLMAIAYGLDIDVGMLLNFDEREQRLDGENFNN